MDARNMFLSTQVSLDGYAAGPDGDLEWTDGVDDEVDELMAAQPRYRPVR